MELSPVLSKLFPQPPGSQNPPQIPRAQYGYPVPPALRPHAGPPQGMTLPNALSMLMLRSNHAAHVNGSLQNQQRKTSSNFEIHPLHPEIRHVVPPSNPVKSPPEEVRKKKRNQHNKSRGVQRQANASSTGGTTPATAPITPSQVGMTLPNALSMLMLRSNHAAHVNGSLQNQQRKTSSNFEIHPLHPEIRHVVPPSNPVKSPPEEVRKKKRNQHNKSRGVQRQANASSTGGTTPATAPITPSQVVSACVFSINLTIATS
ncbi:hypothetical protein ANCCAN_20248 [Ancylostoma caninum]|uniref:Uncharacterized protein n=1 Tax=Ancylostoma caninum TaxID=29170 RepID=A0A368FPA5_ANCCA|nr:hypothetical protein ANCCAN_20248 [Ancylostoma caninum]